jgi:hypothetical protein
MLQKGGHGSTKSPVNFSTIKADDGFYSVSMPGPLFKMKGRIPALRQKTVF